MLITCTRLSYRGLPRTCNFSVSSDEKGPAMSIISRRQLAPSALADERNFKCTAYSAHAVSTKREPQLLRNDASRDARMVSVFPSNRRRGIRSPCTASVYDRQSEIMTQNYPYFGSKFLPPKSTPSQFTSIKVQKPARTSGLAIK